jgi:2-desacetyl-2-hydroxyethyl bacteriochlorophyllide A dehydrogenase
MKAAFYYGVGDIRVEEVPVPEIADDELLVRVKACAVCGTDNRIYRYGHFKIPPGAKRVLGHETCGEIAKAGAKVERFEAGDRVAIAPNIGCGSCHMCIQGFNQLCPTYEAFGISIDGGFAQYMRIPAGALSNVVQIPDQVSYREAVLIEPLSCVYNAYEAHKTVPGDTVLIIGAGPIGALHALLNKRAGGRVVVADVSAARLAEVRKYGADYAVLSSEVDLRAEVARITSGRGVDVVITACSVPEMQALALELAGCHGRVCLFGGLPQGKETVALNTNLIHYKELLVTATTGSSILDFHNAARILATGGLQVASLITGLFPVEKTVAAFEYAAKGLGMKALVAPDGLEALA